MKKKSILKFIETIYDNCGQFNEDSQEVVRLLFRAGQCYNFAKILEANYPGGEICVTFPISHCVYRYKGKCYDIEGIYHQKEHDCVALIPLTHEYLGQFYDLVIGDLSHSAATKGPTKSDLLTVYAYYCMATNSKYDPHILD